MGVNVERVPQKAHIQGMENAYLKLRDMVERAGLTRDGLARALGRKSGSSVQRYLEPEKWNRKPLRIDLVEELDEALVGKGDPPITRAEVWALANVKPPQEVDVLFVRRISDAARTATRPLTDEEFLRVFNILTKNASNESDISDREIMIAIDTAIG